MGATKAFCYRTSAGAYWTVLDERDYCEVGPADGYLRHLRFSRGKSEGTTEKYARNLALYFTYVERRGADWRRPDLTAFQMWLRVTPGPREQRASRQSYAGPGSEPIRSNNTIDNVCIAVCEMIKWAAVEGQVEPSVLSYLYETTTTAHLPAVARGETSEVRLLLRRRHALPRRRPQSFDAPVELVLDLLRACQNSRDRLLVLTFGLTGLRRGEALGLRLSDIHLLPDSRAIGCTVPGPHLHVLKRANSNGARAKTAERSVPLADIWSIAYEEYRRERELVSVATASDFVFVNLWRSPLGAPMKLHAANELFQRLGRRVGHSVHPHMLRHVFASAAASITGLDVVKALLGHAHLNTTQVYLHPDRDRQRQAVESASLTIALAEVDR